MDNKTEFFTLKEDGVIGWIENMPFVTDYWPENFFDSDSYHYALQSAIDSAVEVTNQEEVRSALAFTFGVDYPNHVNRPYPLQCHVEKKKRKSIPTVVALVTFSEPSAGVEETQEDNVSLQWLKDERNILSNTAMFMLPTDLVEKTKRVAQALDITIQYIEENRKNNGNN